LFGWLLNIVLLKPGSPISDKAKNNIESLEIGVLESLTYLLSRNRRVCVLCLFEISKVHQPDI